MNMVDLDPIFQEIINRERGRDLNFSLESMLDVPIEKNPRLSITFLVSLTISIIGGIVGNTVIIGAISVSDKLRKSGNMFIVNLAIADSLIVTVVEPLNVIGILKGAQFYMAYPWLCHAVASICLVACIASCFNLAAIAINRFIHITKFHIYDKFFTTRKTILYCLVVWVLAILLELPNVLGWGGHTYDFKISNCVFDRFSDISYLIFMAIFSVDVSMIVIVVCYVKIYLFVRKKRKQLLKYKMKPANGDAAENDQTDPPQQHGHTKHYKKDDPTIALAKTCCIVCITFFVCLTPYNLSLFIDPHYTWPNWVYTSLVQVYHFNSSLNGLIYGVTNREFREGYRMFLMKICCCKRKPENSFIPSSSGSS